MIFIILRGEVLPLPHHRDNWIISIIRIDMSAGNLFLGFPGRHSSNQPCAQCKLRRRVYDPWICNILMRPELCMHRLQEKMNTLMTSVVGLPSNHPLRLLRFSLWLANHPVISHFGPSHGAGSDSSGRHGLLRGAQAQAPTQNQEHGLRLQPHAIHVSSSGIGYLH